MTEHDGDAEPTESSADDVDSLTERSTSCPSLRSSETFTLASEMPRPTACSPTMRLSPHLRIRSTGPGCPSPERLHPHVRTFATGSRLASTSGWGTKCRAWTAGPDGVSSWAEQPPTRQSSAPKLPRTLAAVILEALEQLGVLATWPRGCPSLRAGRRRHRSEP